jgi:hypothetical protein
MSACLFNLFAIKHTLLRFSRCCIFVLIEHACILKVHFIRLALCHKYGGLKFLQVKAWLNDGKDVRLGDWKAAEVEIMNTLQLLSAKPVVYLVSCLFMIG